MPFHVIDPRGYWKITSDDLRAAQNSEGIILPIDGTGENWESGSGIITILRNSREWTHLYDHIRNLPSFRDHSVNINSKKIPKFLSACFRPGNI